LSAAESEGGPESGFATSYGSASQLIWQRSGERRLLRRIGAKAGYKLSNKFKL
jgi:hypothetical protein